MRRRTCKARPRGLRMLSARRRSRSLAIRARPPHPRPVKPQYAGAGASPLRAGVSRLHTGACPGGSPKGSPWVSGSGSNQPPQSRQLVLWRLRWRKKKTGRGGTRGAGFSPWVNGPSAVDARASCPAGETAVGVQVERARGEAGEELGFRTLSRGTRRALNTGGGMASCACCREDWGNWAEDGEGRKECDSGQ